MIKIGRSSTKPTQPAFSKAESVVQSEKQDFQGAKNDAIGYEIKEGSLSSYVGEGTILTGETSFKAMMRIDGQFKGKISSQEGTLIVGVNGKVEANICVGTAIINGTVNGDIIASQKVELGKTAHVLGNIQTPRLKIEDGAFFEGNCTMLKSKETSEKTENSSFTNSNEGINEII
ncbi:MAG: polymer-forming cytoskeletal protein [Pyrinomonadaceae bacterium]|nr:polymer-forming cytoskeletal protein [Pyrinomonadaceae bacterium]MCX7640221.1 polymer-forming cytoskeletal protein [Pyrinomonadaceae bacterium]MDW8303934.1 polymer-forming cytoskeletal protein [Acidobacteriota bacterium]